MTKKQNFEIGYQVITWDLQGQLEEAFPVLAKAGFTWFEALFGDSLSSDFARRNMTLGPLGPPPAISDLEFLRRLALFGRVEEMYGIRLASLYTDAEWTNPKRWPYERDVIQANARFLKGCGAKFLICGGGVAARQKPHTDEEYASFAKVLEEIGAYAQKLGIRMVYHPHIDCFVETREQLDRLVAVLDTDLVGLCIDPAHFEVMGDDSVELVRAHINNINYFHFKDVNGTTETLTGYDRYQAFCELGTGLIDLPRMTETMLENEFDGLVIIELDYSESPVESCERNTKYVTEELGLRLNVE